MTAKNIPILLFALAGAIFASCSHEGTVAPRAHEKRNTGTSQAIPRKPSVATPAEENRNWAILNEPDMRGIPFPLQLQGIWQPSESDVARVIQEARRHLEKLKKTAPTDYERRRTADILARWDEYLCQVIGHTEQGKRLVLLNFLSKEEVSQMRGSDWRHRYILIIDGGSAFWQIEYDFGTKEFSRFHVNMEA
jgi:hypothetical protein